MHFKATLHMQPDAHCRSLASKLPGRIAQPAVAAPHQPTWSNARVAATAAMGVGVSSGLRLTVPVPHWPYRFCRSGRHAGEW